MADRHCVAYCSDELYSPLIGITPSDASMDGVTGPDRRKRYTLTFVYRR